METMDLLIGAGLPKDLLGVGPVKDYPELDNLWDVLTAKRTSRVVLLYGNPSPRKELLCAALLKGLMEARKKKGLWLTPTRIPASQWGEGSYTLPPSGVTAIVGMDMLSVAQARILVGYIRGQIPEDKVFIIDAASEFSLKEIIGKIAFNYLANYAVSLELKLPTAKPYEVL